MHRLPSDLRTVIVVASARRQRNLVRPHIADLNSNPKRGKHAIRPAVDGCHGNLSAAFSLPRPGVVRNHRTELS